MSSHHFWTTICCWHAPMIDAIREIKQEPRWNFETIIATKINDWRRIAAVNEDEWWGSTQKPIQWKEPIMASMDIICSTIVCSRICHCRGLLRIGATHHWPIPWSKTLLMPFKCIQVRYFQPKPSPSRIKWTATRNNTFVINNCHDFDRLAYFQSMNQWLGA